MTRVYKGNKHQLTILYYPKTSIDSIVDQQLAMVYSWKWCVQRFIRKHIGIFCVNSGNPSSFIPKINKGVYTGK